MSSEEQALRHTVPKEHGHFLDVPLGSFTSQRKRLDSIEARCLSQNIHRGYPSRDRGMSWGTASWVCIGRQKWSQNPEDRGGVGIPGPCALIHIQQCSAAGRSRITVHATVSGQR